MSPVSRGNIARCENVAVIDGGRTVYAVGSPLLQILAYLLMVMVGVRAGILELRETASLFIRATRKAVQGEFDGADQPEAAQSLVAVRRVGLRERGRYEMQPSQSYRHAPHRERAATTAPGETPRRFPAG